MKKIVWTFGLISGGIIAGLMLLTLPFEEKIGDLGLVVGYTTMLLAFLMIYFGIRTYRDNELGGAIRFGRAFQVGILIALISSTWEVISACFAAKYSARIMEKTKQSGATEAQVAAKQAEMAKFAEAYTNPFVSVAYTYLEVFPVGLLVTLVCAGVLSRKKSAGQAVLA
jgi:hypothetical protein